MLTGTPADLTVFAGILQNIGLVYWGLCAAAVGAALWFPRGRITKLVLALIVAALFIAPALLYGYRAHAEQSAALARYQSARAKFLERCKTAGEKITRTVDNVEGVVWMKWRLGSANQDDQFKLDDPFGHDCSGEGCILQLVRITKRAELLPDDVARHRGRYAFVESVDPRDRKAYRYGGVVKAISQRTPAQIEAYKRNSNGVDPGPDVWGLGLEREPIDKPTARYGITWDDLSTREDREHWIAGGSLKILDLQTNEVIAERIGYMMDAGQGNASGGRQPWSYAPDNACPAFPRAAGGGAFKGYRSQNFEVRVLKPAP